MTTKKIIIIVVSIVVVLGLIVLLFVGGIVGAVFYGIGNSEAANVSKDFLKSNERLKQDTGEVKSFGRLVTGNINIRNGDGTAELNLKVIGERKTVNASVELMYRSGHQWRVTIESLGSAQFRVVALGAGHNVAALADQIAAHLPELVSVDSEEAAHDLRARLFERDIDLPRIIVGEAGLVEVATHAQADCVVSATVGAVGFVPTLRALEAGKRVALANKETLVMAGES